MKCGFWGLNPGHPFSYSVILLPCKIDFILLIPYPGSCDLPWTRELVPYVFSWPSLLEIVALGFGFSFSWLLAPWELYKFQINLSFQQFKETSSRMMMAFLGWQRVQSPGLGPRSPKLKCQLNLSMAVALDVVQAPILCSRWNWAVLSSKGKKMMDMDILNNNKIKIAHIYVVIHTVFLLSKQL